MAECFPAECFPRASVKGVSQGRQPRMSGKPVSHIAPGEANDLVHVFAFQTLFYLVLRVP